MKTLQSLLIVFVVVKVATSQRSTANDGDHWGNTGLEERFRWSQSSGKFNKNSYHYKL